MLKYSDSDSFVKNIAVYYCERVNDPAAKGFFSGNRSLTNAEEALSVARAFWQITDLASTDHLSDVAVFEGVDLEFALHKLFNKVYGYYEKNGFKEQWALAAAENE